MACGWVGQGTIVLRNHTNDAATADLRVDLIGGVVLIDASGELDGPAARRLGEHLEQMRGRRHPVVLDLSDVTELGDEAVTVLRAVWKDVGDRLRVVARQGSGPARALKAARLRRFAVHSTLSGALTDASAA